MRPINITLDSTTWEMAKKKANFSQWVRDKLHEEYNKNQKKIGVQWRYCKNCGYGNNSGLAWCRKCDSKDPMVTHSELVAEEMQIIQHDHNQELEE